jgi:hypothetical protein
MGELVTRRVADCTPEQLGDVAHFEIYGDSAGWRVFAYCRGNDPSGCYDGFGRGETIEAAMENAVADME